MNRQLNKRFLKLMITVILSNVIIYVGKSKKSFNMSIESQTSQSRFMTCRDVLLVKQAYL